MSGFSVASKFLLGLAMMIALTIAGCVTGCNENNHHDEGYYDNHDHGYNSQELAHQGELVRVSIQAYTTYAVDIYTNRIYCGSVIPNGNIHLPPVSLYDDEFLTLKVVTYDRHGERREGVWYIDNSQKEYQVDIYDTWSEIY